MRVSWLMSGVFLLLPLGVACGDDDDDGAELARLGDQPVNDHGTRDASGDSTLVFAADDFYFEPTFIRGTAGQKLTLKIENQGSARHNLSLAGTIDNDIEPGGELEVEVTFPAGGVALFFCKYHLGQGMVGELLVGDVQPTAVAGAAAQPQGSDPY